MIVFSSMEVFICSMIECDSQCNILIIQFYEVHQHAWNAFIDIGLTNFIYSEW